MTVLVGDFGGTNCRLALSTGGRVNWSSQRNYPNQEFPSPLHVIRHYLKEIGGTRIDLVCLGAAGPVSDDTVRLTNHAWTLSATQVAAETGAHDVLFLNDLQAQAYALHGLDATDVVPLLAGQPAHQKGRRMVIAVGTGVNAAVAHPMQRGVFVPPSESGHIALPLEDETDLAFASWVRRDLGHVPIEAAVSGRGLARLYAFFGGTRAQTGKQVLQLHDQDDAAAQKAVERFSLYLARYAADLSLVHLPFGGIFLAGSVGLAVAPYLLKNGFADAFHRPGPYADIHRATPLHTVPRVQMTLAGCAVRAGQSLG